MMSNEAEQTSICLRCKNATDTNYFNCCRWASSRVLRECHARRGPISVRHDCGPINGDWLDLHDEDPAASHREHHHHVHPQATSGPRVAQDRGRRWGVAFPPSQGHTLENRKRTISASLVHAGMTWNDRSPLYLCEIHVRKDSGFPLSVRAFSISGLRVLLTNSSIVVRSAGRSAMSFTRPSLRAAAVFLS